MPRASAKPALSKYQSMRDFTRTAEPQGDPRSKLRSVAKPSTLGFVIQKHAASHLHYDFRLELDGVLLSWAVPKGPSLDPSVKRLAVEVEPHPVDYAEFEGTIPKGQYGGGTVMVWDRGTWSPAGDPRQALARGRIDFELDGEKLAGRWHLVRTQRSGSGRTAEGGTGRQWLLFKSRDDYAKPGSAVVEDEPDSVKTGRSLDEIAAGKAGRTRSKRSSASKAAAKRVEAKVKTKAKPVKAAAKTKASNTAEAKAKTKTKTKTKTTAKARTKTSAKPVKAKARAKSKAKAEAEAEPVEANPRALPGAVAAAFPRKLEPELATLVEAAPEGDDWIHEIKFDGYRVLARLDRGDVRLFTRNGKDWTDRMQNLAAALGGLDVTQAWLDGEVVAMNERGLSDFQLLQNSLGQTASPALVYYAFDLVYLDGVDLRQVALVERKAELARLVAALPAKTRKLVRPSEHVRGKGAEFFGQACKLGVEGMIAKRATSVYRSGRGRDWLKVKCTQEQEFVIVGYTDPKGARGHLGALALATRRGKELVYSGRVGTGFSERSLEELHAKLKRLATKAPALREPPRGADARGVHWVAPALVAEIAFTGFTEDGLLRHPTFRGLREDKPAREVELETPVATKAVAKTTAKATAKTKHAEKTSRTKSSATKPSATKPSAKNAEFPLSNPDKVLYPEMGITKRELLDYYSSVADRMLPHVENRALTLVRCPNGRGKPCFFQKHPGTNPGEGIRSIDVREKKGSAPYAVIDDETGLFSLVQLGALEIHTWGSRADDLERPDLIVFDLDPDPAVALRELLDAARRVERLLSGLKLESFVKTTGGKGLHVCVPIAPDHEWDDIKRFAERIAEELVNETPEKFVATQSKAKRAGKIFIDYLRNGRGATFIAPYSTRARENAPIATPLEWDELGSLKRPDTFTLRNLSKRLARLKRDPFERLSGLAQKLR